MLDSALGWCNSAEYMVHQSNVGTEPFVVKITSLIGLSTVTTTLYHTSCINGYNLEVSLVINSQQDEDFTAIYTHPKLKLEAFLKSTVLTYDRQKFGMQQQKVASIHTLLLMLHVLDMTCYLGYQDNLFKTTACKKYFCNAISLHAEKCC